MYVLFKDSLCGGEVDRDIAYEINVSVIWAICTKQEPWRRSQWSDLYSTELFDYDLAML